MAFAFVFFKNNLNNSNCLASAFVLKEENKKYKKYKELKSDLKIVFVGFLVF